MADDNILKVSGVATQYSPLATAPGALIRAKNVMIVRENIAEDRRGHALYATLANTIVQSLKYNKKVIFHHGTTLSYDNGSGTFTDISGSYSAPSGIKMQGVEAFSNLYFTTSLGVKAISSLAVTAARLAGVPRCLDLSYALNSANAGFLANAYQCAYRAVVQKIDSNNNVITGYPSQRLWVVNASGNAKNTDMTMYLPSEVITGDVVQVYRTEQVSGTSDDTSGDETGLVYRYELTSTDISNGYITFTDSVTDALRGETLYTSPSQEGIANANDRPPLCKDLCLHKEKFMIYANTKTKQRLPLTLVGASGLGKAMSGTTHTTTAVDGITSTSGIEVGWKVYGTGIQVGTTVTALTGTTVTLSLAATASATVTLTFVTHRTITLASTTYSFANAETAASGIVKVSTTGTAAVDIDETARSLVRVINRYSSNTTIYAYYTTGPDDLPGQFQTEERGIGAAAFSLTVSNTAISSQFSPTPATTATTKCTSTNNENKNFLSVAKESQGEHVPILSTYPVGPANKEILRCVPLRDSTIIISEAGVFRFAGENAQSFTVTPIDRTVRCKAINSVCVLGNQVFMLSNQGIVAISETGAQIVSRDITPVFKNIQGFSNLPTYTYAFAYESEGCYIISTIANSDDTAPTQTWVYCIYTKAWFEWGFYISCGVVEDESADRMYFAKPGSAIAYRERKDFADTDFADPEYSVTIDSISGVDVTFTSGSVEPLEGWVISQGGTGIAIKSIVATAVSAQYTATMDSTPPTAWVAGAADLFPNVGMDIEWMSWTGGAPHLMKQIPEVAVFADDISGNNTANSLHITFRTNLDEDREEVAITKSAQGWGGNWGVIPWGGGGDSYGYRTYTPLNKQYCARLILGIKHKYAQERLPVAGWSPHVNPVSRNIGT